MATGFRPTSVIQDITVEAPDYSLLTKAATSLENRYLDGFNKYKSTITSLMNAKIRSTDNINFRSEYFKKIDEYLNNLSGVDFSNAANVHVAEVLMDPLIKDPEFVTDLNTSMMQDAERNKMEQVRTSNDPKVNSQYDPIMARAMDYNDEDMKNAKRGDGSIYKVGVQRFVPFSNIQNILNEAAAKQKLEIKTDHLTGAYIVTDLNGKQAVPNFTQWARAQLGSNYDEQLLVTGKVNVRQAVDNLMASDPKMTKELAYQQVAKEKSLNVYNNYTDYMTSLSNGVATIDKQMKDLRNYWHNKIPKGSDDEAMYNQLKNLRVEYQKEIADSTAHTADKEQALQTSFQQFMNNPEYALLGSLKDNIAKSWAQGFANARVGHKIEVNKKVLQDEDHAFRKALEETKHANKMKELDAKAAAKRQLAIDEGKILSVTEGGSFTQKDATDPLNNYKNAKTKLFENSIAGYLDETVLATAAGDKVTDLNYTEVSDALKYLIDNFNEKDIEKTPQYAAAKEYLRKIDGNVSKIESPFQIMRLIARGVSTFKGDHEQWNTANNTVKKANGYYQQYIQRQNDYAKKMAAIKGSEWTSSKYWESDGVVRSDLSDAEREELYKRIIPNYETYWKNTSAQSNTIFSVNVDPEKNKYIYGAVDEAVRVATFISGTNDSKSGPDSDAMEKFRESYQNSGLELNKALSAGIMNATKYYIDGEPYLKLDVPIKKNNKNKNIIDSDEGSISLYIKEQEAKGLWRGTNYFTSNGKQYKSAKYGQLADLPNILFQEGYNSSLWVEEGLMSGIYNGTNTAVNFPSTLRTHAISDGYLKFGQDGKLHVGITINGKPKEYNMGVSIDNFRQDPNTESYKILQSLNSTIDDLNKQYYNQKRDHDRAVKANTTQNPNGYNNNTND
jgi:hypothetical protein